jgi:hypothetical protein
MSDSPPSLTSTTHTASTRGLGDALGYRFEWEERARSLRTACWVGSAGSAVDGTARRLLAGGTNTAGICNLYGTWSDRW